MMDDSPPLNLEEAVSNYPGNIEDLRKSAIKALFSNNREMRYMEINHLKTYFGGSLKGGSVQGDYIILEVIVESTRRVIRAANIPKEYMDVAYHYFQVT